MNSRHSAARQHLISVDDFLKMSDAGLFVSNHQVELINGVIYDKEPTGSQHCNVLDHAIEEVINSTDNRAIVRVQGTLQMGSLSALQPDLALLRRASDYYALALPKAHDALLVIDVAESSLDDYYEAKSQLYAYHYIPEYWLVDIPNRRLTVFQDPGEDGYRCVLNMTDNDSISLHSQPDTHIGISKIMSTLTY